ncbi:hypothetical protein M378DRAFT_92109, partial [Amanita muscaria Koide BX008]
MSTSLNDFYSSVDKLEADGSNWVMFQLRFEAAVKYKKVYGHFDGSTPKPTSPVGEKPMTEAEMTAHAKELEKWTDQEAIARHILFHLMPNSLLVKINRKPFISDMWKWIVTEYTRKSMAMRSHLHAEFMAMRYVKGTDLRKEFDRVLMKYEELVNANVVISTNEYRTLIYNFVPPELSSWLS